MEELTEVTAIQLAKLYPVSTPDTTVHICMHACMHVCGTIWIYDMYQTITTKLFIVNQVIEITQLHLLQVGPTCQLMST